MRRSLKYFVLLFSKHVECFYQQLKVTVTAGVGQSPRKLPGDNLENFNERPDKRKEELEVCGQANSNTLDCQNIASLTT